MKLESTDETPGSAKTEDTLLQVDLNSSVRHHLEELPGPNLRPGGVVPSNVEYLFHSQLYTRSDQGLISDPVGTTLYAVYHDLLPASIYTITV